MNLRINPTGNGFEVLADDERVSWFKQRHEAQEYLDKRPAKDLALRTNMGYIISEWKKRFDSSDLLSLSQDDFDRFNRKVESLAALMNVIGR